VLRTVKWREPARYMAEALAGKAGVERRRGGAQGTALRVHAQRAALARGFEEALFTERTGLPPSAIAAGLARARSMGLVESEDGSHERFVRPTVKGFDFLSDLQALFL
jgi:oxygen-independent coproporphyrinogen-3 oxidase